MQSDVTVSADAISGTLKFIDSGSLVETFGDGNFVALKFALPEGYTGATVKVGLDPTEGTGMVELDSDMNAVFKITDKDAQKLVVKAYKGGADVYSKIYDLSGLTLLAE